MRHAIVSPDMTTNYWKLLADLGILYGEQITPVREAHNWSGERMETEFRYAGQIFKSPADIYEFVQTVAV